MPQQITIEIPDVSRQLYDMAIEHIQGESWQMADFRKRCGNKSDDWIKNNILYNPIFNEEIDEMKRKRQIIEPIGKGGRWYFKATAMAKFLEEHFEELPWEKGK